MPTSYLDLEGLEYLWGKAGETFSPKNIDASSIAANGVEGKTATDNNPLVIKDVAYPQNTKDIVVDLSPVQDFNGYDKPWVGGAGKNKYDLGINTGVFGGITYTIQNGIVTANGTAGTAGGDHSYCNFANYVLPSGTYIVNGCPSGGSDSTYSLGIYNNSTSTVVGRDYGNGVTFTADGSSEYRLFIRIKVGTVVTNLVFKPMMRFSTETDDTFEPYSNICPIYPANGRNLLPLTIENLIESNQNQNVTWNDNSCVINGVTFTAQTDSNGNVTGILANGTATKEAWISIIIPSNLSGDYYFTGCPLGGGSALYDVYPWDSTSGARTKKWDKSTTSLSDFGNYVQQINIVSGHTVSINCRVFVNVTVSNLLFKPMILSASANPTFIPYQSISVNRTGKNLLPMTVDGIKALNTSGSWSGNEYTWNGITYTIMTDSSNNVIGIRGNGTASARGWIFLAEKDFGEEYTVFTSSGTLLNNYYFSSGNTLDDGTKQFIFYNNSSKKTYLLIDNGHVVNDQIWYPMIRLATETDATFEPYQPTSITLSLGQDVYGGTYDVGSGELTITHAFIKMADQTIARRSTNTTNVYRGSFHPTLPVKQGDNPYVISNILQSCTSYGTFSAPRKEYSIGGDVNGNYINFFASDIQTIEEWQAFATENDVQICYELATPITISLSSLPQSDQSNQISLLQGYNVISSSDGISDIEITYDAIQESTVQAEIDELGEISRVQAVNSKATDDAIEEVRNAIDDLRDDTAIVISSVSSESKIASFNDGVEGFPVRDLEIEFEPVQDLHGYSKPWVGGAGKNLLPMTVAGIKSENSSGTWSGNVYTRNGVTYTINTDNNGNVVGITLNGTASEQMSFTLYNTATRSCPFNGYILSGCPLTGSNSTYDLRVSDVDVRGSQDYGNSQTINLTETGRWQASIMIRKNYTASNLVFKPMIRLATETDATFEPYSNICPIYHANGRNLLENTATTQTINGVTFTVNSDDTITANGTATSNAQLVIGTVSLKGNTTYVINGCPSGGGSSTYRLYFEGVGAGSTYDNGSGATYTPTEDENRNIKMVVYSGTTVSNLVFKPMICLASANSTFIPYQAIEVKRTGKNLLDTSKMSINTTNGVTFSRSSDGIITVGGQATQTVYRVVGSIQTKKDVSYTLFGTPNGGGNGKYRMTAGGYGYDFGDGYIFIGDGESHNISIDIYTGYPTSGTLVFKPMIVLTDTVDSTYEPYTSTTLTPPLDRDVYGGRYNVMSGELTIDREYISITPDMIDAINTTNFGGVVVGFTSSGSYTNRSVLLCDSMTAIEFTVANFSKTDRIGVRQEDGRLVLTPNWVQSATTLEQFKSLLSDNPVNIIASLATPITVSLTPQQLTTLSKSNVIMTDSGYISNCEYYADAKTYVDERYMKLYMKLEQALADIDYLTMLTEDL